MSHLGLCEVGQIEVYLKLFSMSEVTRLLSRIESGDQSAAEELLPLVYKELRVLAAAKLAHERPGQTLQATALVHEAYLRLVTSEQRQHWNGLPHFFGAVAEAMRRILIDSARRKAALRRGGERQRADIPLDQVPSRQKPEFLLEFDDALKKLASENASVARLVELRYFGGLTGNEAASVMGVTGRTTQRYWEYARAWLIEELGLGEAPD